ncbi:hypothetical protein MKX03_002726, partial [Papaver bracteatum]
MEEQQASSRDSPCGQAISLCEIPWNKCLMYKVIKAKESNDELIKARKEIVHFHGETMLLENYSALNYT